MPDSQLLTIWIDNDACPRKVREIIFKAAQRLSLPVKIVANSYMRPPGGVKAEVICAGSAFDAADDYIAENCGSEALVITADVPLAARVVEAGSTAISPRGRLFDSESIKEQLAMRNLNQEMRSQYEPASGPKAFGEADIKAFASLFDKMLAKLRKP